MATTVSITDQAITETVQRALAKYPQHAPRIERGAVLLRFGAVKRLSHGRYSVRSSNGTTRYTVTLPDDGEATCTCPDFEHHGRGCKHTFGAWLASVAAIRFEVLVARASRPDPLLWTEQEAQRLQFARWLVQRGTISEGVAA
jgi:uncharacterized Zn finger protein